MEASLVANAEPTVQITIQGDSLLLVRAETMQESAAA